jgi:hypothetical protein
MRLINMEAPVRPEPSEEVVPEVTPLNNRSVPAASAAIKRYLSGSVLKLTTEA